jgi:DNA-binding NarL/FixJ family response regulator
VSSALGNLPLTRASLEHSIRSCWSSTPLSVWVRSVPRPDAPAAQSQPIAGQEPGRDATPESVLSDMIRLLVVDEHPVVGEGIRAILSDQPDFSIETVTDVDSASAAIDARHHDIVLSEIRLRGRNAGLDLLRQRSKDGAAFIMFSAHSIPSLYHEAVEQGAAGFLSKTASPDRIVRSIRTVAMGGKAISAAALNGARVARRRPAPRELEIVVLVAAGATNAEVARRLRIGLPTVEGVLRRLFDRYSVPNRTALARLADSEGWLLDPSH